MLDVEFIAQFLQLRHAAADPQVLHPNTTEALRRLAAAGVLDPAAAAELVAAGRLWHRLLGVLRLTVGAGLDDDALTDGLGRTLAGAAGAGDIGVLRTQIEAHADRVRAQFDRLVDDGR
jgi:glutamate-ammonia-ligase adenylyltransferase